MSNDERNPADDLRATDDAIAEDTVILREIEQRSRGLDAADSSQPVLAATASETAEELREEAAAGVELAREVADSE